MNSSSLISTPSTSSSFVEQIPHVEVQILDRVSRLTLDEPDSASPPRVQTPQVRKRSSSFVVTPPPVPTIAAMDDEDNQDTATGKAEYSPFLVRGLPPMIPDSDELDASSENNPFERHRPMHSPFTGVSSVNADFLASLQAGKGFGSLQNITLPRLARRQPLNISTSHQLLTSFPELQDDDNETTTIFSSLSSRAPSRTRALKMRRGNQDEHHVFRGNPCA
jgi:hypothetical protein